MKTLSGGVSCSMSGASISTSSIVSAMILQSIVLLERVVVGINVRMLAAKWEDATRRDCPTRCSSAPHLNTPRMTNQSPCPLFMVVLLIESEAVHGPIQIAACRCKSFPVRSGGTCIHIPHLVHLECGMVQDRYCHPCILPSSILLPSSTNNLNHFRCPFN